MYQGGPPLYYCPAAANDIAAVFQILGAHAELFLDRSLSPPRRYESSVLPPSNATDIVLAQDWYLGPNGPADAHPDNIGIALSFPSPGGVAHFFNFPQLPEPVGSPATAGLPIPSYEMAHVIKGQQYNHCDGGIRHNGLDFGFSDWPASANEYVLHDVVSPVDGTVLYVGTSDLPTSENFAVSMRIRYNAEWAALLAFEPSRGPWNGGVDPVNVQQVSQILVRVGQRVRKGDIVGQLVTAQPQTGSFGPHLHWSMDQTSGGQGFQAIDLCSSPPTQSLTTGDVCPRDTLLDPTLLNSLYSTIQLPPVPPQQGSPTNPCLPLIPCQ